MSIKSQLYWKQKIQQAITGQNANIDVELGSVYDVLVHPSGVVLEELSRDVDSVSKLTNLSRWSEWSDIEMEQIAANYGLSRRAGTKATGIVVFYTVDKPVSDVVIPRNVVVSTTSRIQFRVTARVQVSVGSVSSYKNAVSGRYEFPAYVEAIVEGSTGNVTAGSIISYSGSAVQGATNVINKAATLGGFDAELNEQLNTRIQMLVQGGVGGTTNNGLRLRLLEAFEGQVTSVEVETDAPIIGSTVDVWFIGSTVETAIVNTYWFGRDIVLSDGPIISVTSISSGGIPYYEDVDWVLIKDTTSAWARTSQARDVIRWIGVSKPVYGAQVTVDYVKNGLVSDIEDWVNTDYNRVMGLELRYREGIPKSIEIGISLVITQGFGLDVYTGVQTAIVNYVNVRGLGEPIEQADLIYVAKQVPGVDNVIVTKLCLQDDSGVGDLTTVKSGYFIVDLSDVSVT